MDPITHTLAGAVMARVGGDRRTPLAAATLILAANAPDLDIFTVWLGSFASLALRRGWSHGPPALFVLALAITGIVVAWDRYWRRRRQPDAVPVDVRWVLLLSAIGVVSHPTLDWLNTYGIRLLMPFSREWFYGDAVFIIDPYWWLLLATTLVLARRRASLATVRTAGAVALAWPLLLIGVSRAGERIAIKEAEVQGVLGVTEVMYQPAPGNPLGADLVAVMDSGYQLGSFRWLRTPRAEWTGPFIERGDWDDPRVVAARADADVSDYLVWSRYPYVEIIESPSGESVRFGDARYPPGAITAGMLTGLRVPVPPR